VMTTEGQGRAGDPVGFGIPVMIEGPWGSPRIYPEMQGILDNPEAAYGKLKEMGKGLFGQNGAGLGAAIGNLLGGGQQGAAGGQQGGAGGQGAAGGQQPGGPLGGQLGETLGNLLQQGLSGLNQGGSGQSQGQSRPSGQRSIPSRTSPAEAPTQAAPTTQAAPAEPAPPVPPSDATAEQDSQPMNEVMRQLFNR
jgi:AsmA protein